MSLALAGLGTAVPATRIDQVEAMAVARAVCRPTAEQATWLPGLYSNSGIDTRHDVSVEVFTLEPRVSSDADPGVQEVNGEEAGP